MRSRDDLEEQLYSIREYSAKVHMEFLRAEKEWRKARTNLTKLMELAEELYQEVETQIREVESVADGSLMQEERVELRAALTTQYVLNLAEMIATPPNWAGPQAEDVLLASMAVILPTLFTAVADESSTEWYLSKIPHQTEQFIRDGRSLVDLIREDCHTYLTEPKSWAQYLPMFADFWKTTVFPQLFPSISGSWRDTAPLSVEDVERFMGSAYDRITSFPKWNKVMKDMEAHEEQLNHIYSLSSHFTTFA